MIPPADVFLACLIPLLVISLLLIFIAGFVAMIRLILRSQAGTRSQLKLIYGFTGQITEHTEWRACEANFGRVGIPVAIASSSGGLHVALPLRWGRTPDHLFIPWPDASFTDCRFFGFPRKRLRFRQVPAFHLDLDPQVVALIEQDRFPDLRSRPPAFSPR